MKIETYLIENTWLPGDAHGWGNGYVGVPKGHPWYGLSYNDIDASVHGGLTYSDECLPGINDANSPEPGLWWVGFDTCHSGDDMDTCPKEYVEQQTENLRKQAQQIADLESGDFTINF